MIESISQAIQEIRRGENLDLYAMLLIAMVIAVLSVFGIVDFQILGTAILAILAILSLSLLSSRKSVAEVKEATIQLNSNLKALQQEIGGERRISKVLSREYPDFSEEFLLAKRISILGTTLASTSMRYYTEFEQVLKRGCPLRIVVCDPSNSEVLKMLALRGYVTKDTNVIRGNIENHLTRLRTLKIPDKPELFEVRIIPYITPYGIVVIENFDGTAKAYVKLTPFGTTTGQFPSFKVNNSADSILFKFFFDQFELFWAASKKQSNH